VNWFRSRQGETLKIFFATDIHGSDKCFRKFLNAAKFYGVDVLILGGDVTGKVVVPIVEAAGGRYEATFRHQALVVGREELPNLERDIRTSGFYYYLTNPDELRHATEHPEYQAEIFRRVMQQSLREWLELAEERLNGSGVQVYMSPGNDDEDFVAEALSGSSFVVNPDGTVRELAPGVPMLSFGYSNRTPWNSPREMDETEIAGELDRLAAQIPDMTRAVFNIHVPPFNTAIDKAPKLTEDLKPVVEGGELQMVSVGSTAVRDALLKYQPLLGLHGHIHESAGVVKLGRTQAINPGSEYSDGTLKGALVTIDVKRATLQRQLVAG
jgi:Icc-related predicted phosphoesterase